MSRSGSVPKRRLALIVALLFVLLCGSFLIWQFNKKAAAVPESTSSGSEDLARVPERSSSSESSSPSFSAMAPPPRPIELAGLDVSSHGVRGKLTRAGSSGKIFFTADELNFLIDRDYDQRAAVEVENRSQEPVSMVAELVDLDREMLGNFVGPGSAGQPFTIAPSQKVTLALHLFAQDAKRAGYHPRVEIKEAKRGEVLAWAPLSILLRVPSFKLHVKAGQPEPSTLALPITITNEGGAITDLAVRAGKNLAGKVVFQPSFSHANLAAGASMQLTVQPRLHTAFAGLEGEIILSGAGQEQIVPVQFALPPGRRVFVASTFCTESRSAADWYCTNRPNINTSIGGFIGGPISPWSPASPYLPQGQVTWQWMSIAGIPLKTNFGPAPTGTYTPVGGGAGGGRSGKLPALGAGSSAGSGSTQQDVDPQVLPYRDDNTAQNTAQACNQFSGGDEAAAAYPSWGGSMHGSPRGKVSASYARCRKDIHRDNEPECAIAISPGEPDTRFLVQAWHSQRWCGDKVSQIALRAWDGHGQRTLTCPILLSDGKSYDRWPTVLALPGMSALVVWETSPTPDAPRSLVYRICDPGFGTWSDPALLPGAQAHDVAGHDSPCAVLDSNGRVVVAWHQQEGDKGRIMLTHGTDKGEFAAATALKGLPPGACCPLIRAGADGALYLIFQAPITGEGPDVHAVYCTGSRDGGATFDSPKRLSASRTEAAQADLLVDGNTLHAVFRTGADWHSRIGHAMSSDNGKTWSEPAEVSPEGQYAEYPSLVLRPGKRVGLEYYGDDAGEPKGPAILKRYTLDFENGSWAAPRRLLTHFPTLTAAWLQANFRLRNSRDRYQPHELSILFNGREVFSQKNAIPEGTYLVPVDPDLLRVDENGLPHNVIGLRTQHMNPGHYSTAAQFRLQGRHAFLERLVIAKDQQEADAALAKESPELNHSLPDVGLFAAPGKQGAALKAAPKEGDLVTVPLVVGNLGEASATNVRIEVYEEAPDDKGHPRGKPLMKVSVGHPAETPRDLKPLELQPVLVSFPFTGKEHYYILAQSNGDDFDPSNNTYMVSFVVPRPPTIQPTSVDPAGEFELRIADDGGAPYVWRLLEAGADREAAKIQDGWVADKLPSGKYRLALKRFRWEGKEIVFPKIIEHTEGVKQRVALRTAIEIELPEGVESVYRWEVVKAEKPDEVVQSQDGTHRLMLVPPGKYRVAIKPFQFDCQRLVWPVEIDLKEDEHVTVKLDSAVKLETPKSAGGLYNWAVVPAGRPEETVQWHDGGSRFMLVPPGKYQVAIRPFQFDCQRLLWPTEIEVKEGQQTTVSLGSAIKLETPPEAALHNWTVVPAGHPEETVQWHDGKSRFMLVPPGKYQVAIRPYQFDCVRLLWPTEIDVKEGQQIKVRLGSAIKLETPPELAIYNWVVVPAGHPEETVQWHDGDGRFMLVPPGKYQVAIRPYQFDSQRLVWPAEFEVKENERLPVRLDSGIKIELPKGVDALYHWSVSPSDKPDKVIQWQRGEAQAMLVPPGKYQVKIQPTQFECEVLAWPKELEVKPGGFVTLKLDSGIRIVGPKDAKPDFQFRLVDVEKKKTVQRAVQTWSVQLVPPGTYRVEIRADGFAAWKPLAEKVTIEAGRITEVKMNQLPGK